MSDIFSVGVEPCGFRLPTQVLGDNIQPWCLIDYGSCFYNDLQDSLKNQSNTVISCCTSLNLHDHLKEKLPAYFLSMKFIVCLPEPMANNKNVLLLDELEIVKSIFHLAGFLQKTYRFGENIAGCFFIIGQNIVKSPILNGLSGLVRILNREWSNIDARFIALEEKDSIDVIKDIFQETSLKSMSLDIYYRHLKPHTLAIQPINKFSASSKISAEDVFLVTAGARGITAQCCLKLAQETQCSFILLGRTSLNLGQYEIVRYIENTHELMLAIKNILLQTQEKATPKEVQTVLKRIQAANDIESALKKFEILGSRVKYYECDILQPESLEKIVENYNDHAEWGPITGLIHGAGNLVDKLIRDKTDIDIDTVVLPKVKGLDHLINLKIFPQMKWCVIFSSVSSLFGNKGQSAYAVANTILNQAAIKLNKLYPHCKTIALCWGAWELGMVNESLKAVFAKRGISLLSVEEGTQLFWQSFSVNQYVVILDKQANMQQRFREYSQRTCLLDRPALEDMSLHANIAQYFGDDYGPMQGFAKRLRMPAPSFLFVSRIIKLSAEKKPKCMGEMWFEYDIPLDTLFQNQSRVYEFVLAESCHAVAALAYVVLKNELLSSPSALRGSNGIIEFYSEAPLVGQTIQGHVRIESVLTVPAGKLLKQVFVGSYRAEPVFKIESYAAIIDPEKVQPTLISPPSNYLTQKEEITFLENDLKKFYQTWNICDTSTILLHRAKLYSSMGHVDILIGEFDLSEDHWVFSAHFVDDPLFPASLIHFACVQLLMFYGHIKELFLSSTHVQYARHIQTKRKLIHSLFPCNETVFFKLEIKTMSHYKIIANAVLYTKKLVLAEFENIGIEWSTADVR